MKHLKTEQLERYAERRVNAVEMMQIVLHLDECRACFDVFQKMFPDFSDAAREVSTEVITIDETENFHLDYDEHLKPFVESKADAVTREIVESHIRDCRFCAKIVRELDEFSDNFHLRKTRRYAIESNLSESSSKPFSPVFFSANAKLLTLSLAPVLILSLGGWLIWRQPESSNLIVENQPSESNREISKAEQLSGRLPEKPLTNQPSNLPPLRPNNSEDKKTSADKSRETELKSSEAEKMLAALPADLRAQIQNAFQTQKITLPAFIKDLRETGKLRGEPENKHQTMLAPTGQAVRAVAPILKWRKFADDEGYFVTIYNKDFNQIAVSPLLKDVKWQIDSPLKRGEIYKWQVKSENSSESYTGQFKVLDEKALERLRKADNSELNSPLVRGIVYASEGLLNEAVLEFQKEINRNPRGTLAKRLKSSLLEKQR